MIYGIEIAGVVHFPAFHAIPEDPAAGADHGLGIQAIGSAEAWAKVVPFGLARVVGAAILVISVARRCNAVGAERRIGKAEAAQWIVGIHPEIAIACRAWGWDEYPSAGQD